MCDYSLDTYRTRPAREGERYVTSRFNSGVIGLVAPGDPLIAVCVPCDCALRLEGIPPDVQTRLRVAAREDVTLVCLDHGYWHDGLRFRNGATMALQGLGVGVDVTVLTLIGNAPHRFESIGRQRSVIDSIAHWLMGLMLGPDRARFGKLMASKPHAPLTAPPLVAMMVARERAGCDGQMPNFSVVDESGFHQPSRGRWTAIVFAIASLSPVFVGFEGDPEFGRPRIPRSAHDSSKDR